MNFDEMRMEDIEARKAELRKVVESLDVNSEDYAVRMQEIETETDNLEARESAIKAEVKRNADIIERLKRGEGEEMKDRADIEVGKNERKDDKSMTNKEVRNSNEYAAAFLRMMKSGDDKECRSLLTEAVSGSVPVPEYLESEVKTAWEEHALLGLVKQTSFKGNVRVAFEMTADGANIHVEGTDAPDEEELTLGVVEIAAQSIKKWITVSDEAIENTTVDTIAYLYREIAHRIVEKAEEVIIAKIDAAPAVSTATAVGVRKVSVSALAKNTIIDAIAKLSGEAKNLYIVMNRGTKADLANIAMSASYAVDVFDGLRDRIIISDKLKNFADASTGDTTIIVGDFGEGVQANFPNGNDVTVKVDDISLAEKDLVKLVGRQFVGIGLIAPYRLVKVAKA